MGSLSGLSQNTFIAASGAIKIPLRPNSIKNKLGQMEMLFLPPDSYLTHVSEGCCRWQCLLIMVVFCSGDNVES